MNAQEMTLNCLNAFWIAQRSRFDAEIPRHPAGSGGAISASVFRQKAHEMCRLFEELQTAREMKPWSFYAMREKHITNRLLNK